MSKKKPIVTTFHNRVKHTLNGKMHREDGPAVEFHNGELQWWINGKLHREDGPAIIKANGRAEWYWKGRKVSLDDWIIAMSKCDDEQATLLKLKYG